MGVLEIRAVHSSKLSEHEQEEMIAFMERYRYEKRYKQKTTSETSLNTELLQRLVEMNDFSMNLVHLADVELSSDITDKLCEMQPERNSAQEQQSTCKEYNLYVKKKFKYIHKLSSVLYTRIKKGIGLYSKKHHRQETSNASFDSAGEDDHYDKGFNTGNCNIQALDIWSTPDYPHWYYPQMQSALMTCSTVMSESDSVVHNNYYPYPTVESAELPYGTSSLNVLRLINLQ